MVLLKAASEVTVPGTAMFPSTVIAVAVVVAAVAAVVVLTALLLPPPSGDGGSCYSEQSRPTDAAHVVCGQVTEVEDMTRSLESSSLCESRDGSFCRSG